MSAPSSEFTRNLLNAAPSLRAFAISLTGRVELADDLVQETLMRAWAHSADFQPGTNLKAWLFTILRNQFLTYCRKRAREVPDIDGVMAANLSIPAAQESHVAFEDMKVALEQLPDDQREALLLVGGSGFSYEEAAEICECAVGTIKSRVNRARARLAQLMYGES